MAARKPLTLPSLNARYDTLNSALKKAKHRPRIGVTQGGSSRENPGAKPAATNGLARKSRYKEKKE